MAEGVLAYDEGTADKNIHTWQRNIGGTNKEDQVFVPGEHFVATYSALAFGIATTTSASHLIFLQADGTNYCRLRRFSIRQHALAGAAATAEVRVIRTSTAGSGGGAISARPWDTADTDPFAGTIQTLPSSKGTEGNTLAVGHLGLVAAQPMDNRNVYEWAVDRHTKPIIWGTATSAGICFKIITGIATSTVDIEIVFTVTSYL